MKARQHIGYRSRRTFLRAYYNAVARQRWFNREGSHA